MKDLSTLVRSMDNYPDKPISFKVINLDYE